MTRGLQQQEDSALGFYIPRTSPQPQHGQKADAKSLKMREPRSVSPRPGH